MYAFAHLLDTVIGIYTWCLLAYVVMGMLMNFGIINTSNRLVYMVMDFLYRITEPLLRPIRALLPNMGSLDLSPLILLLILVFIRNFLVVDLIGGMASQPAV